MAADAYRDWDEIYLDNVARLFRLMYGKVGNRPDAEDLTTEVFLAAYRPLRIEASRGEVRAYLLATARTVLASFWRSRLGSEITVIHVDHDLEALSRDSTDETRTRRTDQLLAGLPEQQREVLKLRFLNARSIKETAQLMGVSTANVKVLQHRGLRLAAHLAKDQP